MHDILKSRLRDNYNYNHFELSSDGQNTIVNITSNLIPFIMFFYVSFNVSTLQKTLKTYTSNKFRMHCEQCQIIDFISTFDTGEQNFCLNSILLEINLYWTLV